MRIFPELCLIPGKNMNFNGMPSQSHYLDIKATVTDATPALCQAACAVFPGCNVWTLYKSKKDGQFFCKSNKVDDTEKSFGEKTPLPPGDEYFSGTSTC